MALPSFQIEITEQGWLGTPNGDYDPAVVDLCTHGDIRLVVGGEIIAAGGGGDGYGISEAALGLLRTVGSDYERTEDPDGDRLIPHGCGTTLMMGCGIGIDWSVRHLGDQVRLSEVVRYDSADGANAIRYPGLEVQVASSDYGAEIVAFAEHAKEPFQGLKKSFSDRRDRREYKAFWKEYEQLLRAAG